MEGDGPKVLSEGAERLAAYRAEVNAAVQEARKAAPVFSAEKPFALLRLHSACQIHPLIAQQWRGRLPEYAVIAANTGYLPGGTLDCDLYRFFHRLSPVRRFARREVVLCF